MIPIAAPEARRSGISLRRLFRSIFCFVSARYTRIRAAARMARYSANSPELKEMFRVKSPSVPKIAMDTLNMIFGRLILCASVWLFLMLFTVFICSDVPPWFLFMEVDFYSVVSMPQMKCILIWSKSIFYKVIYFADFVNKMRGM